MTDFLYFNSSTDFDDGIQQLIKESENALTTAYAPYSQFKVGAAVLLEDGTIVKGSNQENAAYPSGLCAERVALFAAAAHYPGKKIVTLVVVAKRKNDHDLIPVTPCGACRQVMLEMEIAQTFPFIVIMKIENGQWVQTSSAKILLPFSFSQSNLNT